MEFNTEYIGEYDVVVVGGGVSGCHAALASARLGVKTLLIEQFGFLGGSLTAMGVGPMMTFHNRAGKQLVFGSPQEMVDRLVKRGASPGHIVDSTGYCSTLTPFDAESLKVVLEEMLTEASADILYHTRLIAAKVEDKNITSIFIHNRGGIQEIKAKIFIDASGDAELSKQAGIPFVLGREEDNKSQPLTMNVKIGNVNTEVLRTYIENNWDQFDDSIRTKDKSKVFSRTSRISLWGFYDLWQKAKENGEVTIPRDNVLFFETNTEGEFIFNTSRILDVDPTNPLEISGAETTGRKQCQEIYHFLVKYVPGFENASMISTAPHVGIRESRHPVASYVINADDLVNEVKFDDAIAVGGYPIDIHSPDGGETNSIHLNDEGMYYVPMKALLTDQVNNLVLAGRAIGADHHASAAIRVTPIAMSIGQGAGTLAALACKENCSLASTNYKQLKEELLKGKVYLG